MTTRDGVRLDADLYRPDAAGEFPVLLMRQPYGRRIASTVVFAHPRWYAAQGYLVVIQDVRGRGSSEGRFRLFADDVADGGESVSWAARLPGSSGRVGMYGFSYQANTQLLALASGAPELAALCPTMTGWDMHSDWAYEGGAFCFAGGLGWGIQMAAEQARLAGDEEAFQALFAASRALPVHAARPAWPPVMEKYGHYGHYPDWIENPAPGDYWDGIAPRAALEGKAMDVPMLHIGGWYDSFLMGTLNCYRAARARSSAPQKLVIGPWTHLPWGRRVGGVDFGPEAVAAIDRLQLAWFDRFLKGVENGIEDESPVRLFDLAARTWRTFEDWPQPRPLALFTDSDGLAATTQSGVLAADRPAEMAEDSFVHDPWRPVPFLGGHNAQPGGMQERGAVDDRSDVLCFTTAPLDRDMCLAGEVSLTLSVSADCPSFDISAILSQVTPEGKVYNLTQGYRRVDGVPVGPVTLSLRALCATLPAGHALRLSIAAANFPAFAVNPGTGQAFAEARSIDNQVVTLTVTHGGTAPSRLDLPLCPSATGFR
ncbi:CocE/NonD family hydrolase [Telmatospirillum sp. J64-1]|uniref:CocE/NonD family hydrolase n=1 Tax=Telmatospirillum sp. J64-1 TaxID=2502183 RepID=UPI00115E7FBE|nr:CocE/NonD family hydrolase [Telmatospirillum sp. J64-1]